jgi:hypothetical protein
MSFPAIPLLNVETVLGRLPAAARARVAWAKKPIQDGLSRLRTEPVTDELVAEVADELRAPIATLGRVFSEIVAARRDESRAKFDDDFELEERQLAAFVEQEDSRDTLRWVLALLQSVALTVSPEVITTVDENVFAKLGADEDFKPYIRTLVVLMAVAETRTVGGDPQRARDLLDVAFLEMNRFRATLRKQGVWLTPFPFESVEERHRGLLEAAARLRQALSDDDWLVLEQARMRDLH